MPKERFDKIISNQFNISRKEAKIGIKNGKGTINGVVVKNPAVSVDTESDIFYNGEKLDYKKHLYVLMNKPRGVLSASEDKSRKTVVNLLPAKWRRDGMAPVGRLDKDTTGFLIITDDGDFAHRVISPNKNVDKTYIAFLDNDITEEMKVSFSKGVVLADGTVCKSAVLERLSENVALIKISEGKYHQVKRMFGTVGLGVNGLKRVSVGGLSLPQDLAEGDCRLLCDEEIGLIFKSC